MSKKTTVILKQVKTRVEQIKDIVEESVNDGLVVEVPGALEWIGEGEDPREGNPFASVIEALGKHNLEKWKTTTTERLVAVQALDDFIDELDDCIETLED